MATVTARNSKLKRVEPYAATASKKRKFKAATSSSPSNGSSSSSLLELYPNGPWPWRETKREASKRYVHELYPHITPQDDYELSLLLFGGFDKNGTIEEFHEYVTDMLEISWDTNRRMGKKNAIAKLREDAKKQMDGPSFLTGVCTFSSSLFSAHKLTCSHTQMKPLPDQNYVHIRPPPDSQLSMHLWVTSSPNANRWCLDFVRTTTDKAVNTPPNFELHVVPDLKKPWLPCSGMKLTPLCYTFGVQQKDIKPGMETYVLLSGVSCCLVRPGHKNVMFVVPMLPQPTPAYLEDCIIIDFD
ncbi:hypothetical protein EVG20_g5784 [Dentipellis fragilis]|uniref:Uncharacterized protein n=1 Tax=Dentipellis fragilis TaxID=205917 RepID=A0A4Y9YT19_9AGAM|nr:hypothetical protein EVG20_g5784 [Dentipellis fragilis]